MDFRSGLPGQNPSGQFDGPANPSQVINKAGEWSWVVPVRNSLIGKLLLIHFRFNLVTSGELILSESWVNYGEYDKWRIKSD